MYNLCLFFLDHYILLWKYDGESQQTPDSQGVGERENWLFDKCLRKHIGDVSDLSWSPDGAFLLSGSVDNTAALWDVKKVSWFERRRDQ